MTDNELTYIIKVPAEKLDTFTEAMAGTDVDFSPTRNLVEIGYLPDDAIYIGGETAGNLVDDINEFLKSQRWTPEVPAHTDDWTPWRTWVLLEFAAEHMAWEDGSIDGLHPTTNSQEGWLTLVQRYPEIFG